MDAVRNPQIHPGGSDTAPSLLRDFPTFSAGALWSCPLAGAFVPALNRTPIWLISFCYGRFT